MTDPLAEKLGINVQEGRGFFQQGLYKQNDGDNDGAIEEYRRAVQIEPDLAGPHTDEIRRRRPPKEELDGWLKS